MTVLLMPGLPKHYRVGTQRRYTAEAMQNSPYTIAKGPLFSPRMNTSEDKSIKSKLLASLACKAHKIITSESPDFKNPTLHQTLEMLQCTIKVSTMKLKGVSIA